MTSLDVMTAIKDSQTQTKLLSLCLMIKRQEHLGQLKPRPALSSSSLSARLEQGGRFNQHSPWLKVPKKGHTTSTKPPLPVLPPHARESCGPVWSSAKQGKPRRVSHALVRSWALQFLLETAPLRRQPQALPLLVRVLDSVKIGRVLELWHNHLLASSQSPVV